LDEKTFVDKNTTTTIGSYEKKQDL